MPEVTPTRRALGAELKALRTMAGETQRELAGRTRFSQVAVTRVENGQQLLPLPEIEEWLDAYDAGNEVRDRVTALARAAHHETMPWPESNEGDVLQGVASDRETSAVLVRNFTTSWIPGLLQTAEYARQLMPQTYDASPEDYAAALASRIGRQQVLFGEGRRFEFLITEDLLTWTPAPRVMAAQLDRLLTVATLESVELRVLPSRRAGTPSWHSFILFTPADEQPVYVTTELLHGGLELRSPDVVALYEQLWTKLWDASLHGDDVIKLLRTVGTG